MYSLLHQFFSDITNRNSFKRNVRFSQTNNFLKSFYLVIFILFQALIGQKYGYRPIPASVDGEEFEIIRAELEQQSEDLRLLDTWYLRDENCVPPQYVLQPINAILKNYDSSVRQCFKLFFVFNTLFRLETRFGAICKQGRPSSDATERGV